MSVASADLWKPYGKKMKHRLIIALPCYNESENLPVLLGKFADLAMLCQSSFDLQVVVINDASTDNTTAVLKALPENIREPIHLRVMEHPQNRGLTGGLLTAFQYFSEAAHGENPPFAVGIMDGDNSHHPGNIPAMLNKIIEGYDVVIASRYQKGSRVEGVNWWRRLLSRGMGVLFKLRKNIPGVWDYSCGYRLYSPAIVQKVSKQFGDRLVTQKNFSCMVELLVNCHKAGAIMTEAPFLLRYDLKKGESKMQFRKTILGTLNVLKQ